jgi:hypothetical protein
VTVGQFGDGRLDVKVILDVPTDWNLPATACKEILDVLSAVARRASGAEHEQLAG